MDSKINDQTSEFDLEDIPMPSAEEQPQSWQRAQTALESIGFAQSFPSGMF